MDAHPQGKETEKGATEPSLPQSFPSAALPPLRQWTGSCRNTAPLYICGPTASGKSSFALALARELDGEIINADPFQAYRGLAVLSAAPTENDKRNVPHHLYGILDPETSLDAAQFRALALPYIERTQKKGRVPLVVGGSGLYLKFLTHGPSPLPQSEPSLRRKLEALPTTELIAELETRDPTELARLGPHNRRYLIRALEIALLTGQPPSTLRTQWEQSPNPQGLRGAFLQWPRPALRERIAIRARLMLANGAIDEVRQLPTNAPTSTKAIGVKEIRCYLDGSLSLDACLEAIITSTSQYAKRQQTWFRKEKWLLPIAMP